MQLPKFLFLANLMLAGTLGVPASAPQQAVIGYLPEYRLGVVNDDTARFEQRVAPRLTDLLLFSIEPRPKDGRLEGFRLLPLPKALRPGAPARAAMRVLVSVGGAGRSEGFRAASSSDASRARFGADLAAFVARHGFDGADIDWEFPASPKQQRDMSLLLLAVRAAFDGGETRLLLTAAVHGVAQPALSAAAVDALDRVHLMSYDMQGGVEGHAPFDGATEAALAVIHGNPGRGAAPVPAAKLALGVPAYGREVQNPGQVRTWGELVREALPPPKRDIVRGFGATGVDGAARKAAWAREQGLAGVMYWEIGQDALPEVGSQKRCGELPGSSCGGDDDWSLLLAAHGGDPASPLHGVAKKARRAAAKASRKARKARKAARKDEL